VTEPVVVVGAGPSGLGCATELAEQGHRVLLFDRIPVAGGTAGWESPAVRRFVADGERAGVRFRLGETATRWDGIRLAVAGPGRFEWIAAGRLYYAGGLRPATAAHLRITGDRPAGVLPATVAEHLLQAGVRLWSRVVIVGDGPWAPHMAARARELGGVVVGLAEHAPWADEQVGPPERISIVGRDRVRAVRLHDATGERELPCDAVLLAADPRPNRNVAGALVEPSAGVTFIQPTGPADPVIRHELGRKAAQNWLSHQDGAHR
jgi:glycine/D-amino acid oxidase-like deaminating enzyme